jgi:diadenylate cyclase
MTPKQDPGNLPVQSSSKAKGVKEMENEPSSSAQSIPAATLGATLPAVQTLGKGKQPVKGLGKLENEHAFLKESLALARHLRAELILFISDLAPPMEILTGRGLRKLVVVATHSEKIGAQCEEQGLRYVLIPGYAFDRLEKIKVSLAACVSARMVSENMRILCLAGQPNSSIMDTCMLTRLGIDSEERAAISVLDAGAQFQSQVLEAILLIALSIGYEGFEGAPVGTIFVVGDCTNVLEKSRPLTLNPFQGYSEDEKNILDPKVRDAIKNFSLLDGAFVIREDGVVLAAGRYLQSSKDAEIILPLGLGTRNAAAMGITKTTGSIAFVISKTTGAVRIYKHGVLALEIKQPRRRLA